MPIDKWLWRDNERLQAAYKTARGAVVEDTSATWLLQIMRSTMHHLKELAALVFCRYCLILARSRVSSSLVVLIAEPIEQTLGERLARSTRLLLRVGLRRRQLLNHRGSLMSTVND